MDPIAKEFFDAYLIIGYTADEHKLTLIGDLGHPKRIPEINKKLRPIYAAVKELATHEENTQGLDLL